ncbi:MAG TPA: hypothetical protein O0X07_06335 [Methanocorpusculum sp.]|nr:hypothetical protein [Methanocorpusculum sp.]
MTPTSQPITLSLTAQEASDLIAALELAADSLHRSPHIFEAKCLDKFHNILWEAFKDQYIRQETPDFYAKLLAAEKEART